MNYEELYRKNNSYEYKGHTFTIIDTRLSKTGRISAKISTTLSGVSDFWTGSVNPKNTEIGFYISTSGKTYNEYNQITNIKIK